MAFGLVTVPSRSRSADDVMARHARKVQRVATNLARLDGSVHVSLRKRAVAHQVPKRGDKRRQDAKVDLTDLDEILEIDPVSRTCTVEPGVTFVDLVAATLAYGLVPTVVPELETITVGGAVSGCSLESMSFRYGGLHDACLEYEVITTDGEVLVCRPDNEHRLVFEMMHGSFGTLGVLSKVTFRLVAARPFVEVTYDTYRTFAEYREAIARHTREVDVDFMDGIIHSPEKYVLCLGRFVDRAPYTNRYDWVTAYYETTALRTRDYFQTKDYFFRYDRGVTNVHPRSKLARLLFGKVLSSATLLRMAETFHRLLPEKPSVIVDLLLPASRSEQFMTWYDETIGHYPLWCVPYRCSHRYAWIADGYHDGIDDELFLDIAIYGLEQPEGRNYYAEIEKALFDARGIKTLISYNYYDEETFWRTWNKPSYDAVKRITDPKNVLRDLYTKMCRATRGAD